MAKVNGKQKKNTSNLIIRGTAKVFKYNAGVESVLDGNSAQQPFIAEYKGERQTALEYIWHTKDLDGTMHKRGIFVSGHGEYGVPTLYDYDVYVALQDIFIAKKTNNNICELKTEDITDEDLRIEFSINELAREMGYKSPNNLIRENLRKSIKTLLATTIFSLHEGGIYDIRNKKYITNKETGFHYLEEYEGYKVKDEDDNELIDITKIKLSRYTYHQIINDYKLFYNKQKYTKIKNRMAKKIYHMLLQWKGKKDKVWVNLNTLIEKTPMIEDERRYQKRYIKNALKLLNDNDIIKINYDARTEDLICCDFTGGETDKVITDKFNKFSEIKEYLYGIGFDFMEIDEHVDIENIRYIQALLRYIEDRNKNTMGNNRLKKYILKCLSNPQQLDSKYYSMCD